MDLGSALLALVDQQPAGIDASLPAVHAGSEIGEQVHATVAARLVAAERLEALAPEHLKRSRHFLDAREAVVVPWAALPGLLCLIGARDAELRVLRELAEQILNVVRLELDVGVEVGDDSVG